MPIFRGVEMAIVASRGAKKLPEYPHPDGSSVRLMSVDSIRRPSPQPCNSSIVSETDPTRQKKMNPRVSVYIPSIPGEQFWLKYSVIRCPPQAIYLYFKMFMNGRNITSWGIPVSNEVTPIKGTVVRAMCEPGERWSDRSDIDWRTIGIETRYFHFMPGVDTKSAAEDGGLIEIQIFRSKGRKRRVPKLTEFRNQERYGIAGGLVENPQDATYYDWLLLDPKDEPFASFCFHYRSMKHLLQLSLVPREENHRLNPNADLFAIKASERQSLSAAPFAFGIESLDDTVFNDSTDAASEAASAHSTPEKYFLKSPPTLTPAAASGYFIPQPSKASRDAAVPEALQRPLPEPPREETGRSRHSSRSSLRSSCPSLTPSLAQYVDSGDFGDDEVDVGMAKTLIPSVPSMVRLPSNCEKKGEGEESSLSDYDNSPPSTIASRSPELPPPDNYLSTTGSVLERHIEQFASPVSQRSSLKVTRRVPASDSESTLLRDQLGTLKLTESEWIRRTPSPIQRKTVGRLWSPRLERKATRPDLSESHHQGRYSDIGPRFPRKLCTWESDDEDGLKEDAFQASKSNRHTLDNSDANDAPRANTHPRIEDQKDEVNSDDSMQCRSERSPRKLDNCVSENHDNRHRDSAEWPCDNWI